MASLNLKNIYKVYPNGTKAVNDFSMDINDKEFIVFVGPSGCGKSTVLRMLAGLEEITAGELKIDGEVVNDVECKKRDTAMVFQNYALYPHMTVAENMAFPLKMTKPTEEEKADVIREVEEKYPASFINHILKPIHKSRIKQERMMKKVMDTAQILGLEEYLGKKPGAMSGGQRQRVALGRAMVRNPKVFLLDEPLSNLDAKLRTQMRAEITKLHKRLQTTFVYVTHDQTEAMTMGDRIVVMKKGVIQQIDTPVNLYAYPANKFVAGFIGTPSMNFFDASIKIDGETALIEFANGKTLSCPFSDIRKTERKYFGEQVTLGVRPENIYIAEEGAECVVVNRELLGSETLLYCDFDTENAKDYENSEYGFILKTDGSCPYGSGDRLHIRIDFKKAHFFDKESETSIKNRLVKYNDLDVSVQDGRLLIGSCSLPLPPALQGLKGELRTVFPTDAVTLGEGVAANVCECERIGDAFLARLEIGGISLYAVFSQEVSGEIAVNVQTARMTFIRNGETIKEALETENKFSVTLRKSKLTSAQRKALPDNEYRTFDIEIVCGETVLKCPLKTAKRLLGASDRKLFGVPLQLRFQENDVKEGNTFQAAIDEVLDYGSERYALCTCMGNRMTLPYRGEAKTISFDIDLLSASVYDAQNDIKIS